MKEERESVNTRTKIALRIVKEAIENVWNTHEEGCEFNEDRIPKELKQSITTLRLEKAKRILEDKHIGKYHSQSRYFDSICSNVSNRVTDDVWSDIQDYFDRA